MFLFPILDFSAQQSLLSDLLSNKDAPPVTASEADALDARAQVDTAAVSMPAIASNNGATPNAGPAIGSEILAELEEKMSAGSELLANVEAKATALVGQEEVVTVPKPLLLGSGAGALALAVGIVAVLSNNTRQTEVRRASSARTHCRRARLGTSRAAGLRAGVVAAGAGGVPRGE